MTGCTCIGRSNQSNEMFIATIRHYFTASRESNPAILRMFSRSLCCFRRSWSLNSSYLIFFLFLWNIFSIPWTVYIVLIFSGIGRYHSTSSLSLIFFQVGLLKVLLLVQFFSFASSPLSVLSLSHTYYVLTYTFLSPSILRKCPLPFVIFSQLIL